MRGFFVGKAAPTVLCGLFLDRYYFRRFCLFGSLLREVFMYWGKAGGLFDQPLFYRMYAEDKAVKCIQRLRISSVGGRDMGQIE